MELCPVAKRIVASAVVLFLMLAMVPFSAGPASAQPTAPVERLNTVLLDVMQNADALGFEGRFDRLEPILTEAFAFDQMARLILGPDDFSALSVDDRAAYVDAFTRMSIATFAARFNRYGGQQIQVGQQREIRPGQVLVETVLQAPGRDPVSLDYVVREIDDSWRILDVFLDRRVSEVARQRADFTAVYRREGLTGLLAEIEASIARHRASG